MTTVGRGIPCATVNDTMSDPEYLRAAKSGGAMLPGFERRARIATARPAADPRASGLRHPWPRILATSDALDLTPRLEAPRLTAARR